MYSKLFVDAGSLLILPGVALVMFIAIFAGVVVTVVRKKATDYAALAALPLGEEDKS